LHASKFAASFASIFSEKLSTLFLATFKKRSLSRSVRNECRKLPGRHRRVFSADMG
jgi:hypothetical protein